LATDIAIADIELILYRNAYQPYEYEDFNRSAVFLLIDRSASMGQMINNLQSRLEVVKSQLVSVGNSFFNNNKNTRNMTMHLVFFNDQVVS